MLAHTGTYRGLWVVFAAVAMACGQVQGPQYQGEPLATITGQITAEQALDTGEGVRLALAWYPETTVTQPKAIVTQDVVYKGSFPLNYTFGIFKPPPLEALRGCTECDSPARAAMGVLLVYKDRNGNGQLDTIAATGTPVDRVLGSSFELLYEPTGYLITYLDAPVGPDAEPVFAEMKPGFNLVTESSVVPLSTPVPLKLTGWPDLDLFVCDAYFTGEDILECGLGNAMPPAGGASLTLSDDGASAQIFLFDGFNPADGAIVTLDGKPVPQVEPGRYELEDPSGALLVRGATHVIRAQVPGKRPLRHQETIPGAFSITSPLAGSVLVAGAPLTATWTHSSGADSYLASLKTGEGETLAGEGTDALIWTTAATTYEGDAALEITATRAFMGPPMMVTTTVTQRVPITLAP